jgi:arylsulfatase A-like enzyme
MRVRPIIVRAFSALSSGVFAIVAALFIASWMGCGSGQNTARPDVVVIMIDTLRPDHLGFHGYPRETAPFLAELSRESAVFRRAFSTSTWTAPSTASVFTSLHPMQHRIVEGLMVYKERAWLVAKTGKAKLPLNRIPEEVETLPMFFASHGYQTIGLGANINIGSEIGFARGFDLFERLRESSAEQMFARLRESEADWDPTRPKFVYLHFNDVHGPYEEQAPWFKPSGVDLTDEVRAYDSEISYLDATLRKMFAHFGWGEDTIVVVVSDHGEEFMEHGDVGHNLTVHREVLQVLLMIRAPGRGWEGRTVDANVMAMDVLPTLADLIGLPANSDWAGQSLVERLDDEPNQSTRLIFGHRQGQNPKNQLWSAIADDWHLIRRDGQSQLYNLSDDPKEQQDLVEAHPEVVGRLESALARFRATARGRGTEVQVEYELDADGLRELRALGYVDDEDAE